jgi:hypothetical protein
MGTELSPEYWRARAEETRVLAGEVRPAEVKLALIRTAEDYERIAKAAEYMQKAKHITASHP